MNIDPKVNQFDFDDIKGIRVIEDNVAEACKGGRFSLKSDGGTPLSSLNSEGMQVATLTNAGKADLVTIEAKDPGTSTFDVEVFYTMNGTEYTSGWLPFDLKQGEKSFDLLDGSGPGKFILASGDEVDVDKVRIKQL